MSNFQIFILGVLIGPAAWLLLKLGVIGVVIAVVVLFFYLMFRWSPLMMLAALIGTVLGLTS